MDGREDGLATAEMQSRPLTSRPASSTSFESELDLKAPSLIHSTDSSKTKDIEQPRTSPATLDADISTKDESPSFLRLCFAHLGFVLFLMFSDNA
jgi:hypothetical protein